jgi:hypothetical protein
MSKKEELKMELNRLKYRHDMLGIMEVKLLQMKEIAVKSKEENLSVVEIEILNNRINKLATQVNAIDEESKNIENVGTLE